MFSRVLISLTLTILTIVVTGCSTGGLIADKPEVKESISPVTEFPNQDDDEKDDKRSKIEEKEPTTTVPEPQSKPEDYEPKVSQEEGEMIEAKDSKAEVVEESDSEPAASATSSPSTARKAYQNLRALIDGSYTADMDILLAGENLPGFHKELVLEMMSTTVSMFDETYGVISPYTVIAFTHDDLAWADQKMSSYPIGIPDSSWQSWAEATGYDNDSCWLGSATLSYNYMCMPSDPTDAEALKATVAHEYFHSIQGKLAPDHRSLPVWVIEGSATYVGNVAAGYGSTYTQDQAEFWQTYHLTVTYGGEGFGDYVFNMTPEQFVNVFKELEVFPTAESVGVQQKFAVYQTGSLATEYLIGTTSYEAFMQFIEDSGSGTNWKTAFEDNFEMDVDDFYLALHGYLKEQYQ